LFQHPRPGDHYNEKKTKDSMLTKVAEANFPSRFGHFRIYGFQERTVAGMEESVVLRMGDLNGPGNRRWSGSTRSA